jgi:hypothetical protein
MSDFREKIVIAVVSAVLGAGLGFGSKFILQGQATATAREEAARKWSYELLKEEYDYRRTSFLEISAALRRVEASATPEDIEELVDAISMLPILEPRYPTNYALVQLSDEFSNRIAEISDDPAAVKDFVGEGASKYICIMDVNLSAVERLLEIVATEEEMRKVYSEDEQQELEFLGRSCFEDDFRFATR